MPPKKAAGGYRTFRVVSREEAVVDVCARTEQEAREFVNFDLSQKDYRANQTDGQIDVEPWDGKAQFDVRTYKGGRRSKKGGA